MRNDKIYEVLIIILLVAFLLGKVLSLATISKNEERHDIIFNIPTEHHQMPTNRDYHVMLLNDKL